MAYSLLVRQHEIIIVQGAENQNLVFDLFTVGMNPCVGLVLWHPKLCALAHIDDPADIPQFAPVIAQFSKYCKDGSGSVTKPFASIVMAHGIGGGKGWWSEHMKCDLETLCSKSNVVVSVVRPMKPGDEAAMVKVTVSNGARGYDFPPGQASVQIQRNPRAEDWVTRPIGAFFRFGFFAGKDGEIASINYVKGTDTQAVTDALAKQA
jgi:hypothetical protein